MTKKPVNLEKLKYSSHKTHKKQINAAHAFYESGKWQFLVKKSSNPYFTQFGKIKLGENELPLSMYRKISGLYESILDAKTVLLRYKSDIATVVAMENDCITPLAASLRLPMVFYKREDLTSIKAYKIRGAVYQMSKIIEENHSNKLRFVAASTGNHALGTLKAAEILKVPGVTICISESVTKFKKQKLEKRIKDLLSKGINAELLVIGENFDQTNKAAIDMANSSDDIYFIDPYNKHNAVAGQGTIGLEILAQLEHQFFDYEELDFDIDKINRIKELTIIVPIGGGGLISGISTAVKLAIQAHPRFKHLKVKVVGVRLKDLNSKHGDAIKVKTLGDHNQDVIEYLVDKQVTVTDMDMQRGINFILDDLNARVEGASAATLKPVFDNMVIPSEEHAVICIVSGGNTTF